MRAADTPHDVLGSFDCAARLASRFAQEDG